MKNIGADLSQLLQNWGLNSTQAEASRTVILILGIILVSIIANWLTKLIIKHVVAAIVRRSKNDYDDIFLRKGVFNNLSHIVPAILIYSLIPVATDNPAIIKPVQDFAYIYMIFAITLVISSFLKAVNDIYEIISEKKGLKISLKQFFQVINIIVIIIAVILVIAILINKKPGAIFAGLGAMTAVLMLIFRDSILGFVAGIQLSAYDMVREGDWITVPSRGVDGDVIDISLTTVKIRNFDKTISTIPTYALVQESFINWKGMQLAGARRIKRAVNIDMDSIKICTPEMVEKFKQIPLVKDYVEAKAKDLGLKDDFDTLSVLSGRALTNLGVFRAYIENYLRSNFRVYKKYKKQKFVLDSVEIERFVIEDPEDLIAYAGKGVQKFLMQIDGKTVIKDINKFLTHYHDKYMLENDFLYKIKMVRKLVIRKGVEVEIEQPEKFLVKNGLFCDDLTVLVRQLKPTDKGLPVEVYVFAATTAWIEYEKIMAELFEHILAVMHVFELRVYQAPTGKDVRDLTITGVK